MICPSCNGKRFVTYNDGNTDECHACEGFGKRSKAEVVKERRYERSFAEWLRDMTRSI